MYLCNLLHPFCSLCRKIMKLSSAMRTTLQPVRYQTVSLCLLLFQPASHTWQTTHEHWNLWSLICRIVCLPGWHPLESRLRTVCCYLFFPTRLLSAIQTSWRMSSTSTLRCSTRSRTALEPRMTAASKQFLLYYFAIPFAARAIMHGPTKTRRSSSFWPASSGTSSRLPVQSFLPSRIEVPRIYVAKYCLYILSWTEESRRFNYSPSCLRHYFREITELSTQTDPPCF